MEALDNRAYLAAYIISNLVGMLMLFFSIRNTRIARLMFLMLFAWACWANLTISDKNPDVYLEYAGMAHRWYADFINGWFRYHIRTIVALIAVGQGIIALGMLLKRFWVSAAAVGAILFLMAIAPLGVGAGFPFSITASVAAFFIIRKDNKQYIWEKERRAVAHRAQ